ncbi:MAG: 23S rRNA (adenine(2503)-C(2))-methyltransferase RlmN [Synergistaceae bacterium]|jgi:23S rRNA (adenine2503-C2)-methyltransferase|nr:23S rRNA (adenine(2503)-C(2))-methyltransferase RlmN [Synergistaceae bacterium]
MTDGKRWAFDLSFDGWTKFFAGQGQPSYRAGQICAWLWKRRVFDPEGMTDFGKELRAALTASLDFSPPEIVRSERAKDGTRKFLLEMRDGTRVETALIKQGDRLTACISTQAGCPIGCPFCATGTSGFERNLTSGEIASQLAVMEQSVARDIQSVVLMGMGEPFLNTEAVLDAIRALNHSKMRGLGVRHFTVSTAGIIPGIEALAASGLGVRLAVSLHASDDELRDEMIPCNTSYPLKELVAAMKDYQEKTGDRLTIEYALFKKKNDTLEHARKLARLLHGIHAYINLIPANDNLNGYERSAPDDTLRFQSVLKSAGFETEIRAEHGSDISAACGQLKGREPSPEVKPRPSRPEIKSRKDETSKPVRATTQPHQKGPARRESAPKAKQRGTRRPGKKGPR